MGELINDPFRAARLVLHLRRQGVTDHGVLNVIERVRRGDFVDTVHSDLGDEDCVLPLPCGQTQPRPSEIATVLQAMDLEPGASVRVLLIGEDSGYTAALLSALGHSVYVVTRYRTLLQHMETCFAQSDVSNVRVHHGDAVQGWPASAPFDRIAVMGGLETLERDLTDQLSPQGIGVAILGAADHQYLTKFNREGVSGAQIAAIKAAQIRPGASSVL